MRQPKLAMRLGLLALMTLVLIEVGFLIQTRVFGAWNGRFAYFGDGDPYVLFWPTLNPTGARIGWLLVACLWLAGAVWLLRSPPAPDTSN